MSCLPNCLVGYTGFVGSNLLSFYKFDYLYNSKNFNNAKGKEFDTVFFCGMPAVKWLANKNPETDAAILENIQSILQTIKANKFVLISTIDVYEYVDNFTLNEDYDCDWINNHAYGRNRYLFELFVKKQFANDYHIVRLPALFGKGLKKNVIYDLIHNNQVENISALTKFQWYDLNWLKEDIDNVIAKNIKVANLFTEPLETQKIIELFDYSSEAFQKNKSTLTYNLSTKFLKKGYIRSKEEVLSNIKAFLEFEKIDKSKLVVSNICTKHILQQQFANILKLYGIQHVQIAPTTLIDDWTQLLNIDFSVYEEAGLQVYSWQSICYGILANIFDESSNKLLLSHMRNVVDVALVKGAKVLVFGCPRNRKVIDTTNIEKNEKVFVDFFSLLGNYIGERNLTICLENNSKEYGCNFLNTISEVGHFVEKINYPKIKMMVDVGNAMMENDNLEDIKKFESIIYNIDVANPNMKPLLEISHSHVIFKSLLDKINYNRKINLEMQITSATANEELDTLKKSLEKFISLHKK